MTFYEAALEVLRNQGQPLHFERITALALEGGLLSHTGRIPEAIMQARLVAMARQDTPRLVAVTEPGVFGLAEWGVEHDDDAAAESEPAVPDDGAPLRPVERLPMPIKEANASREAERAGRFEADDRAARARSRRRHRRPHDAETPGEALAALVTEVGGGPIDLIYVVEALPRQKRLPEGFPEDIAGLLALAQDENARLVQSGESPLFVLEGERITVREAVPVAVPVVEAGSSRPTLHVRSLQAAARELANQLGDLGADQLEAVCLALAEEAGLGDLKVAKRSAKGSPLFTGRVSVGMGQLRLAIRVLVSGRNVRPDDVDEVRADLEHYSAAAGVVVTSGKVPGAARGRADDNSKKPVVLFDGAALAELMARLGVGVRFKLEERVSADPAALRAVTARRSEG